jgi:hypothetical protein
LFRLNRFSGEIYAKQYQMFNLYVMLEWPMNQERRAAVLIAKMRIGRMINSEVGTLEKKMILGEGAFGF